MLSTCKALCGLSGVLDVLIWKALFVGRSVGFFCTWHAPWLNVEAVKKTFRGTDATELGLRCSPSWWLVPTTMEPMHLVGKGAVLLG